MSDAAGPGPFRGRRFLLVSTNYAPELTGIGPYASQLAEHWAASGARVRALTGMPHYPSWRLEESYRRVWRTVEIRGGVGVHRRRHYVPPRQTALKRAAFEASILATGLIAPPPGRPDVVISQMPSLAGGVIGARLARHHRVPYLPVVQDLMGAAAAQSGIRGGGRAAAVATAAERYALRGAALVGVIHESFVPGVRALGVDPGRIRLVPNWTHVQGPTADRAATRARLGWSDGVPVILHSGNMGLKQGLEVLVEAARLTPGVRVVLMGDGNQRDALRARAEGLANVEFMEPAGAEEFTDVLAAADVLAVTQRASVLDMSVPSKLTSYFTSGRPVIASVADEGGTADEVRRSGAGVLVAPEDPAALLEAVQKLAADPAAADALGAEGPRYVARHLSREAGLARFDDLLAEVLRDGQDSGRR
ncbi:glycosyltransferase WbuB [Streptomyces griseus]|uniref:glycosyltransferase n=1 Tax=Streptomyces globisporus TaxID=1908 RepID=UPI0005C944A1|nr:glycosyltransferase [Streptomyces globisporus]AWL85540.1 glycosyltransferase WbuB [Streptomyces globisporus]PPA39338.1 glycosyltransferase WbuB [Streptomyces griseus]RAN16722.1 glycosyltransferase WbuB [Streptomyces badius]RAN24591.1 glycosyltransferase WbuB [Streptomyces badius]